jgi:hypothetical protein
VGRQEPVLGVEVGLELRFKMLIGEERDSGTLRAGFFGGEILQKGIQSHVEKRKRHDEEPGPPRPDHLERCLSERHSVYGQMGSIQDRIDLGQKPTSGSHS